MALISGWLKPVFCSTAPQTPRYGRLAGFTNQKPPHTRDDGRQPYVLAHDCPGQVATAAPAYLERLKQALDKAAVQAHRQERPAPRGRERDGPGMSR